MNDPENTDLAALLATAREHQKCPQGACINELEPLRGCDKWFQVLTENVASAIFVTQQSRYVYVNMAFEKITGYTAEELYQMKNSWEVITPDQQTVVKERALARERGEEVTNNYEIKIINKDGTARWMEYRGAVIYYAGQSAILGSGIDITKRKLIEKQLQESETRHRLLFEGSYEAMTVISIPSMKFVLGNKAAIEMFGVKDVEEFTTMAPWDLSPEQQPDGRASSDKAKEMIDLAIREGSNFFEWTHRRLNGKDFPTNVLITRLDMDEHTFLQSTVRDITAQKRAEEEVQAANEQMEATLDELIATEEKLRNQYQQVQEQKQALLESEQRLEDIINFLPDATLVIDREGKVVLWNQAMEKMTGVVKKNIIGRGNYEHALPFFGERSPILIDMLLMPNHDYNEIKLKYDFIRQEANNLSAEVYAPKTYDGKGAYLWGSAAKLYDLHGNTVGAIQSIRDISERKEADVKLQESEEKHRLLIENSHDIIYMLTIEGVFTFVSSAWTVLLGHSINQVQGHSFMPFVHPDDLKVCMFFLQTVIETGQRQEGVEYRVQHMDGSWRWHTSSAVPIRNEAGVIMGIEGTARDITDTMQANEKVRSSEEQFRLLITEMLLGLALHEIICDDDGNPVDYRFISVNDSFERLTGLRKEDIIGKTVLQVLPNTEKYWIETYGQVALTGKSKQLENYSVELDKYYNVNVYSPKLGQFAVIIDDVTERKKMEQIIYNEKERFKTTLLSVGDGVISTDNKGNVLILNKVAETLTGWTQNEVIGRSLEEVFHIINEFTRERCENPVYKALATEEIIELANHTILISRDGSERFIEDSAAPIRDNNGNINGVVLVFRDCTEKKQRQEKIEYLSFHDALTGLYNRRFFDEEVKRLDTERNIPLTLVMLDVNGLKLTNDAFGHVAGDELLKKVAEVLKRECRADDIIARIGGDEFVVLLPKTEADQASQLAKRIGDALANQKVEAVPISVSCGWGTKVNQRESVADVFKIAEDFMYRDKISERSSHRHESIQLIMKTLYEKSPREQQHSNRVSQLCGIIGSALGLSQREINELITAGVLHDIGKITISDSILDKFPPLVDSEWMEIKRHPEGGYSILSSVNDYAALAEYVLAHHERWDGTGYPNGLKGEEIPLQARIIAVADAYDAMTSNRPYRQALSKDIAVSEIKRNADIQFDLVVARVLVEKVLGEVW